MGISDLPNPFASLAEVRDYAAAQGGRLISFVRYFMNPTVCVDAFGRPISRKEREQVRRLFFQEARTGNVESQFVMGELCENGWGGKQNDFTASHWYRRAAWQGGSASSQSAQFQLGRLYVRSPHFGSEQAEVFRLHAGLMLNSRIYRDSSRQELVHRCKAVVCRFGRNQITMLFNDNSELQVGLRDQIVLSRLDELSRNSTATVLPEQTIITLPSRDTITLVATKPKVIKNVAG